MMRGPTVTVAGAGALGLSCALALADAGCRVTVVDPAEPLANASGVAAGMLAPVFEAVLDPVTRDHFDLLIAARNLWPGVEARAGVSLERSGALAAGAESWISGLSAAISRLGVHPTELPRATAQALAPGLAESLESVLLTREDWRLDPTKALLALRAAGEAAGVDFQRAAASGRGDSDLLVIATGASPGLQGAAPELSLLTPIKGHILRAETGGAGGGMVVRGEGVYAAPAAGGLVIGATMEVGVSDAAVDPEKAEPLTEAGARLFPAVAGATRVLSAGVRGATPDGLPLVGPSRAPGVLLAVGARRNGWLVAPLVARMVAAYATGRDPGVYADRLSPARFTSAG